MIAVNHLSFAYTGAANPAVRDVSFAIERGEIFGFLGPSGAGKSTTQKILIGLLRDYLGEVHVLGRELRSWGSELYERVGVSFEAPNHFLKLTALENLAYFRSLYRGPTETPQAVLEQVGLAADGDLRLSQFSKGMSQRLNVARALLHRPALLFLDEPTSGLDPVNAQRIKELIRRQQAAGTTIFLTTHNMAVADELCDRIAFIVDGEIKLVGTPRALKQQYGRRQVQVEYGASDSMQCQLFSLDALGQNSEFLQLLRREQVQTIHTQETTLEKVFIEVTGRSLL